MITDLYSDERPTTAHELACCVGAFKFDLVALPDRPLAGRQDEETVIEQLKDYYLQAGRREMADHVLTHYHRCCECWAKLAGYEQAALAAGLSPELARVCRQQRIALDLEAMNMAGHQAVALAGGRIDPAGTPGIQIQWTVGGNWQVASSLVEAIERLRDSPVNREWHGNPCFVLRVYS